MWKHAIKEASLGEHMTYDGRVGGVWDLENMKEFAYIREETRVGGGGAGGSRTVSQPVTIFDQLGQLLPVLED